MERGFVTTRSIRVAVHRQSNIIVVFILFTLMISKLDMTIFFFHKHFTSFCVEQMTDYRLFMKLLSCSLRNHHKKFSFETSLIQISSWDS